MKLKTICWVYLVTRVATIALAAFVLFRHAHDVSAWHFFPVLLAGMAIMTFFQETPSITSPESTIVNMAVEAIQNEDPSKCEHYRGVFALIGTEESFLRWFVPGRKYAESIVMAAALHPTHGIYAVTQPGRHHHCARLLTRFGLNKGPQAEKVIQGFITSYGRFVGREEALKIADAVKQRGEREKTNPPSKLFSEDLWD